MQCCLGVDCHMLVSLLKICSAIPIFVEISFSVLLIAEMKLPRYEDVHLLDHSSLMPLTVVFLVLRVFSFMNLVLVLRPTVSAVLPTLSGVTEERRKVEVVCTLGHKKTPSILDITKYTFSQRAFQDWNDFPP